MAKLKRDERVCPYCAETIKASAIKCRYCQSDVTPVGEPAPSPEPTPEPKVESKPKVAPKQKATPKAEPKPKAKPPVNLDKSVEPEPVVEDTSSPKETAGPAPVTVVSLVLKHLTAVLAVLVLLAGAGVGVLWSQADGSTQAAAPSGALVGDDARNEVLVTAADLTQRTLSYNYKTLANDMQTARAKMTPAFRKEYDTTMAQVKDNTTTNKIVLQATAVASAIIEATEHKAKVLVFVNQTTSAGAGKSQDQQLNQNSLVVTLTRSDGDWVMSKLTALG